MCYQMKCCGYQNSAHKFLVIGLEIVALCVCCVVVECGKLCVDCNHTKVAAIKQSKFEERASALPVHIRPEQIGFL